MTKHGLLAIVALALISSGTAVVGQSERAELAKSTPEQRAKIETDFMKSHLELTDEQLSQVSQINLEYAKKADPLLKGSEGDLDLMKEMKTIQAQKHAAMQKVLTPDQIKTLESLRSEIKKDLLDTLKQEEAGGS
jgi:hypothetical protein